MGVLAAGCPAVLLQDGAQFCLLPLCWEQWPQGGPLLPPGELGRFGTALPPGTPPPPGAVLQFPLFKEEKGSWTGSYPKADRCSTRKIQVSYHCFFLKKKKEEKRSFSPLKREI